MAAYSAVVSLAQLLKQLVDSDQIELHPQLQSFHDTVSTLQTSLQRIFPPPKKETEAAHALDDRIREAIYEAQDAVESFLSGKTASFSLETITAKIDPVAANAMQLADSIRPESRESLDGDIPPPPRLSLIGRSTRIVGQEEDKMRVSQELTNEDNKLQVLPITGMPGIGKTTLARSIYDDPKIKDAFLFRAWVTVSQNYNVRDY